MVDLAGVEIVDVSHGQARRPCSVVLTSRADNVRTRLASCAVASLLALTDGQLSPSGRELAATSALDHQGSSTVAALSTAVAVPGPFTLSGALHMLTSISAYLQIKHDEKFD